MDRNLRCAFCGKPSELLTWIRGPGGASVWLESNLNNNYGSQCYHFFARRPVRFYASARLDRASVLGAPCRPSGPGPTGACSVLGRAQPIAAVRQATPLLPFRPLSSPAETRRSFSARRSAEWGRRRTGNFEPWASIADIQVDVAVFARYSGSRLTTRRNRATDQNDT
jgi:hypothetical protein